MRVLVTGGCGFLGSHVCEYYIKKGDKVIAFDNMTKYELSRTGFAIEAARNYNWYYLKKLRVRLVKADIRNFKELLDNARGVDFIIHTAAQPAMTISWEDPLLDFTTNALGTFNVLEVAKRIKVPVVSCATIHVYGNEINKELKEDKKRYVRKPIDINEEYPTLRGIITPLHASKGAADIYVKTYIDTYKLEAASFRLTGLYGPRQFGGEDHGWVANFSIRAVMGWPINIYGKGKQVRDILYATDVCEAFDAFYKRRMPGIYNIGGGSKTAISLLECVNIIGEILGKKPEVNFAPARYGDLKYFVCDISKANRELNWRPKINPITGIKMLINWIKANKRLFVQKIH
jgi:CDP-paratose 2-epimerase